MLKTLALDKKQQACIGPLKHPRIGDPFQSPRPIQRQFPINHPRPPYRLPEINIPHPPRQPLHPLPLKHLRYPSKMTVCIAAICQKDAIPMIILCSDTRQSRGDYGSTDRTQKIHLIKNGWTVQAAHREDSAGELIERVREWFDRAGDFTQVHSVISSINAAVREFDQSPLCEKYCCQLLITGFVKEKPVIAVVTSNDKGKLTVQLEKNFFAIGSGLQSPL